MSTRLIVGVVGGIVGAYFGYPQLGFALGSLVGGALEPPIKVEGPRLQDHKFPQASYGSSVPFIQGCIRTAGVIIWASNKREIATTTDEGGKGGPSTESTTYTYEVDMLYLLSDNELSEFGRIWKNGELIAEDSSTDTSAHVTQIFRHDGSSDVPDAVYEAAIGVGNAPAYVGRGTIMMRGVQLGSSGQVPNFNFEVCAGTGG